MLATATMAETGDRDDERTGVTRDSRTDLVAVPRLHPASGGQQVHRVGWLELFYDLVYVATIIQLGNALSAHVSGVGALAFVGVFVPVWWSWLGMSYYSNRFAIDDLVHRVMVLAQMAGVSAMAVAVPRVLEGEHAPFALAYAWARAVLALMYLRTALQEPTARRMAGRFAAGFIAASVLWAASAWVAAPTCFVLWGVAIALSFVAPISEASHQMLEEYSPDLGHLAERFGLLTIIVLGESFVKVLGAAAQHGMDAPAGMLAGFGLIVTCSLWWLYFDEIEHGLRPGFAWSRAWIYAHLPLTAAITALGVGLKKAIFVDVPAPLPLRYRLLLSAAVSAALLALALIEAASNAPPGARRRARVVGRFTMAAILMALASAGGLMPAWVFLATIATLMGTHVVMDTRWRAPRVGTGP